MRTAIPLALAVFFSLTGCDKTAVEPRLTPDVARHADATASTYTPSVLPNGDITGFRQTFFTIDAKSDIFGSIRDDAGLIRAALWSVDADGSISAPTELGMLPDPYGDLPQTTRASNARGVAVGYVRDGTGAYIGWTWTQGAMTLLQPVPGAEYTSVVPLDVSSTGVVVGQIGRQEEAGHKAYGAVWLPPYDEPAILLPVLEGYVLNSARHVTDGGLITGWVRGSGMPDAVVQWQIDANGTILSGPNTLPGSDDVLFQVGSRDLDLACLYGSADGPTVGCLYRATTGERIDLGPLDGDVRSYARGVTPLDADGAAQLVGTSFGSDSQDARAVLWSVDAGNGVSGPVALPLPSVHRRFAQFVASGGYAINEVNRVIGWSEQSDGRRSAVLWQPEAGDPSSPPSDEGLSAGFDYACDKDTCQFTDTSTGEVVSWSWETDAGHASDSQNPTFTFSAGTYTVTLTVTDSNDQADSASTTIECKDHKRFGAMCS